MRFIRKNGRIIPVRDNGNALPIRYAKKAAGSAVKKAAGMTSGVATATIIKAGILHQAPVAEALNSSVKYVALGSGISLAIKKIAALNKKRRGKL